MWSEGVKFCNENCIFVTVNTEIIRNFVHLLSELLVYWGKQSALKVSQNGLPKTKFAVECVGKEHKEQRQRAKW